MKFVHNMYVSDKIKHKLFTIHQLKMGKSIKNIYLICIDKNSNSVMEIINSHEIHKQLYSNRDYIVIGIANSKNDAKQILLQIIQRVYSENNQLENIKNTLINICTKEE